MPQLPPVQPVRMPQASPGAQSSNVHIRKADSELLLLCQDARVSPDVKRRLHVVLDELRAAHKTPGAQGMQASKTVRTAGCAVSAELQGAFARLMDGQCCVDDRSASGSPSTPPHVAIDLRASFRVYSKTWSSTCVFTRPAPALQTPADTFQTMNATMLQTLRYVDTVGDLDFDITCVRDYDGSVMCDSERLFLSVCCSVFANFAFCTTLGLDAAKLVHFLRDIFQCYVDSHAYHNSLHTAEALQMLSLFFREPAISCLFSDTEMLCCLLAVLALDVAHPGVHNASLALMQHPLVAVYSDAAPSEQAALLVFLHKLGHDNNDFLYSDEEANVRRGVCALRHTISELVLSTALGRRNELMCKLRCIADAQVMQQPHDTLTVMSAMLVLATCGFALRPRQQCAAMGRRLVEEMRVECTALQRQRVSCDLECVLNVADAYVISAYCATVVWPLAEAVQAVVPSDLYDNLQHNIDLATTQHNTAALPVTLPLSDTKTLPSNCSAVAIDTLRKIVTHATSLDRKASQYAILHASPARALATVDYADSEAGEAMNGGGGVTAPHSRATSAALGHRLHSQTSRGGCAAHYSASVSDGSNRPPGIMSAHATPQAEHYFSFLRLYDKCEREEQSTLTFCGQLVFLALQLNVLYIAPYARAMCSENASSQECEAVAGAIMQHEEPPCSAESVVRRHRKDETRGTPNCAHDGNTDAFVLLLMHMYSDRHTDLADATDQRSDTAPREVKGKRMGTPCQLQPSTTRAAQSTPQHRSLTLSAKDAGGTLAPATMQCSFVSLDSDSHESI